jgi:3-methyl-2-oxobutanoate hydroxymethyltransferase
MKEDAKPIVMVTAYDYTWAGIFDEAGVDMLLVGDSLGNNVLGYTSTLPVTLDEMIHHGKAVARGAKYALVVVDLPFMSYQASIEQALMSGGRVLKETGAQAVKLEGGAEIAPAVSRMTLSGIPVVAHIGLTPQHVNQLGGYKVQGKGEEAAKKLLDDARSLEEAGAFAIVLECVPAALAAHLSQKAAVPTIGIGAGAGCDGQVLVYHDLLGLNTGFKPKFVKRFKNLRAEAIDGIETYCREVRERSYPSEEYSFKMDEQVLQKLY